MAAAHLFVKPVIYTVSRFFAPDVRPDVRAAPMSSDGGKKNAGGPGGGSPPAKPVKGGSGGAKPPQPKFGGSGGQRPPAKIFSKKRKIEKTKNTQTVKHANCLEASLQMLRK